VHQILSERGLCSLLRCETQLAQEVSEIYRNHQVHQHATKIERKRHARTSKRPSESSTSPVHPKALR